MNKQQKELIQELIFFYKKLGHSPKRRDVPKLAWKCYKHFGSFNKAKKKAGLKMVNVRIIDFPNGTFELDKNLARIASYLMFDGHLYKDLKGLMYSSKNINDLKEFEKVFKRKFGNLREIYHLNSSGNKKQTHKIYFFNKIISTKLFKLGIPKGDKTITEYLIPKWIIDNKEFSKEFVKIAYLCEGSMKENRKNPRITISINKSENLLDSGLKFMEQMKKILDYHGIKTTNVGVYNAKPRKDGVKVKMLRFRVITKYNNKFIKEIGWLK